MFVIEWATRDRDVSDHHYLRGPRSGANPGQVRWPADYRAGT